MIEALSRNWGWVALRGVVAILFGILTLNRPGISLASLVLLFGAYSLVDGSFMVVSAIANRKGAPRWVTMLFGGVLGKEMHAAMNIGVATLVVTADGVDDDLRFLRGGRVIQVDQRLAANGGGQDREVAANGFDIERSCGESFNRCAGGGFSSG